MKKSTTSLRRSFSLAIASFTAIAAACGSATAQPIYTPPPSQDFQGVWLLQGDHRTVRTTEGKVPPLNKAASAVYAANIKARKAGRPQFDTIETCKPHGFPRILFSAYPIQVLQEPKQVTFVHEVHHFPRLVYLDMTPADLDNVDPNWMGLSVGRWEGNTLVVESKGFYDTTTLDAAGLPHSTDLKVTERIRKVDADTFEDVVTINDPKTYTKPWSTRVTYKRQAGRRLAEYACTEKNPESAALNK